jgi:amino-acid N-acetyltransferase
MTPATPAVRASTRGDFAAVAALLAAAGLPTEDLDSAPGLRFWVAVDAALTGAIGLESYGAVGLLRSLVVAPTHRNCGLGSALVRALEQDAAEKGTRMLVLLTQTAEPFFKRMGYQVIERDYVPDEVKHSAEFVSLCPASAVCMTKTFRTPDAAAARD